MTLSAADQGAWASGIGAFVAAGVALLIALGDGRRRRAEARAKATLAMASLYSPVVGILQMLTGIEEDAEKALIIARDATSSMIVAGKHMHRIKHGTDVIEPLLAVCTPSEALHLPSDLGPVLVTAIRDVQLLTFVTKSATDGFFPALKAGKIESMQRFVVSMKLVPAHAQAIEKRLRKFIDACVRVLGNVDPKAVDSVRHD